MKRSTDKVSGLLMGIVLAVISCPSWATFTATLTGGQQTVIVPLSPPVISAGVDVPVGTVIYQASLTMKDTYIEGKWVATDVGKYLYYATSLSLKTTPKPLSGLTTGPYANGVYETGIPGIGVAIITGVSNRAITPTKLYAEGQNLLDSSLGIRITPIGASSPRSIVLVKTGPLVPGTYSINGANFPTTQEAIDYSPTSHTNAVTISGLPLYYWTFSFQGSITVSAQTCSTPVVAVYLGSYDINEHFSTANAATPWVDASINLTNCPQFYGFYNSTNAPLLMNYNTGSSTTTTSLNNSLGVRLTPTTTVLDATNGIMAIDSTVSGAASGVGIQLGWGESAQAPTPFNFSAEQSITLPKDGSSTVRIPLAARYIKTAATPTPGKANGKVVFTINYY
ncbi:MULTISPECIES: fimbrial protein [Serratia]|uniref:fimbrial protein n=1 Tax=Serratia TaxID=613 RepID=UPI000E0EFFC9|nr:fimbrial protein [Serratia fonticola]